jgi:hypothetical protein
MTVYIDRTEEVTALHIEGYAYINRVPLYIETPLSLYMRMFPEAPLITYVLYISVFIHTYHTLHTDAFIAAHKYPCLYNYKYTDNTDASISVFHMLYVRHHYHCALRRN